MPLQPSPTRVPDPTHPQLDPDPDLDIESDFSEENSEESPRPPEDIPIGDVLSVPGEEGSEENNPAVVRAQSQPDTEITPPQVLGASGTELEGK